MSDIAIKIEGVSKQYRLGTIGTGTLQHDLNRWWHLVRGKEDPYLKVGELNNRSEKANSDYVWALHNINLEIERGEVLGIIGKNGAGKSTLLKILSRVTAPTTGVIKAKGRIASLLEVGTGFHGELTGRQNVYMNGAIMGMTKAEIKSKMDEIIDFAGVEKYIDTPVKRYSSGMNVRLGFAVAAHLDPEILVVDEVLAVGDAEFQKKAIGKMKDVSKGGGRTVLFVSHQLNSVSTLCSKCMLMENGTVNSVGQTQDIIAKYLSLGDAEKAPVWINNSTKYWNRYCAIQEIAIVDENKTLMERGYMVNNNTGYVKIRFDVEEMNSALCVGFAVYDAREQLLFWAYHNDAQESKCPKIKVGENVIYGKLPERFFNEGEYFVKPIISLHYIMWIIDPASDAPVVSFNIAGGLSDSLTWQMARPGILAPVIEFVI